MSEKNEQSQSFEQSMARLEQIVRAMERGDVPLEESLKLFEEGPPWCAGAAPAGWCRAANQAGDEGARTAPGGNGVWQP